VGASGGDPAGDAAEVVSLTIDFGDGIRERYAPAAWREGMTVRDLMVETRQGKLKLEVQGSGQAAFLKAINGVANEGADGRNWTYAVNGKPADRSFAVYELQPGDEVLWTFAAQRYNSCRVTSCLPEPIAMSQNRQQQLQHVLVFGLLVAIGVVGRWGQPVWEFTPIAAATIFAGFYFPSAAIAALVPLGTLAIGDVFLLPAHDSVPVIIATYGAMTLPVWLGRWMRADAPRTKPVWRWAVCGLLPATMFYLVTNFAVWAFQSNYEKSLAGLVECYWAAVPFYRWMLAGDVFYLVVLLACWSLAGAPMDKLQPVAERADR
jgi:hypothetical protein